MNLSYSISGDAKVIQEEKLKGVPLKLALMQLDINEVRDVMFYGSKITVLTCNTIKHMI